MKREHPAVRAEKTNHLARAQRQTVIDTILGRALRGVLTIPEAALLADYVRAERQVAEKTRRSLADTTRALHRHREAADAAIQALEARVAELDAGETTEGASGPADGRVGASEAVRGVRDGRGGARAPQGGSDGSGVAERLATLRAAPSGPHEAHEGPSGPVSRPNSAPATLSPQRAQNGAHSLNPAPSSRKRTA